MKEGNIDNLTEEEIAAEIEALTSLTFTPFPCTNAYVGPFCKEISSPVSV